MSIDKFTNYLKQSRGFADNTVKSYTRAVKQFQNAIDKDLENADIEDIDWFVQHLLGKGNKPTTVNLKINAIKSYYSYIRRTTGEVNTILNRELLRIQQGKKREILTENEVKELLKGLDKKRLKAMISILFQSGLRIGELVDLNRENIEEKEEYVKIKVKKAKGKKTRYVYMDYYYYTYVKNYLKTHKETPVFISKFNKRLGKRQAMKDIKKAGKMIGKDISPHDLRASCFTYLYQQGMDIYSIAEIAGHSNIQTTQRYIKADEKTLSEKTLQAFK